ncbi:MAG TPA: hypothetical protein PLJ78_03135 [Anaerolineae bacterium]|nr:hypothetical protein [Anaerolineae bacterium]HQK12922.1 hypothetical protein [Anaerolineae bacterium]
MSTVPRLDLAPKRKKPLSLWNPLDYLTLLYWAFLFPQAIRWYVETFGLPEYQGKIGREVWQVLAHDPVQRNLVLQMFVILLILLPCAAWVLQALGVSIDWFGVAVGVAFSVAIGRPIEWLLAALLWRLYEAPPRDPYNVVAVAGLQTQGYELVRGRLGRRRWRCQSSVGLFAAIHFHHWRGECRPGAAVAGKVTGVRCASGRKTVRLGLVTL